MRHNRTFFGYGIRAATLAALVMGVFSLSCNRSPEAGAAITAVEGAVALLTGEQKTELSTASVKDSPVTLKDNQTIETGSGSRAEIRFKNGMLVRVGANSVYRYLGAALIGDLRSLRFNAVLQSGSAYFKSDKLPRGTEYHLRSTTAVASVRGTEFVMHASEEFSEILVREGQIDVKAVTGTQTATVNPGERALVDRQGNITVTKMTAADQAGFDILSLELSDRTLDESKEFTSDEEIRAHYGTLYEVTLVDDRVYNGFLVRNGQQVKIHTTYGVIELPNDMIANARELDQE